MERSDRDVGDFIESLPAESRDSITTLDGIIADVMTGLPRALYTGTFWGGSHQEIIGYGSMEYQRSDGADVSWFLVGLAQQKNYISLYINAVEDGQYLSEKYGKDLGKVRVGKASVSFKDAADLDTERLRVLIARARAIGDQG